MKNIKITLLVLFLITFPTFLSFLNPRFFYTQDHIFVARLHQMSAALFSGQFPVRWAPDLRFGEPLFNFYAPLPFYLGSLINMLGINIIWSTKILFILSSVLSSFTMYLFSRKLFSKKASIFASILYVYAPYRAVDIYVRGALSEAWAFVFFPLIFYTSLLLSEKLTVKRGVVLSLSLAGLFLTHNVATLIFLPFLFIWWIYLFITSKKIGLFFYYLGSFALAFGISAFFILPALFERQFIQTKYLIVGYFNFRAHFVAFKQFFSLFWGYGSSLWGPVDGLSFQVGLFHWIILALALFIGFIKRGDKKLLGLLSCLGISFILSLFLQHNKSAFIWESIPLMAFIQFPWRFLAVSIFIVAIAGGVVADYFENKFKLLLLFLFLVIVFNFQYFRPEKFVDDSFFDKFLKVESMTKGVDLTKDYLPIWAQKLDTDYFATPRSESGEINVLDFKRNSNSLRGSIDVKNSSVIVVPIYYFPGWDVLVNGKVAPQLYPSREGLIRFALERGSYKIDVEFKDTIVRTWGNILSLVSVALATFLLVFKRK